MKVHTLLFTIAITGFILVPPSSADTLRFADGREVEGVIKKVESGTVAIGEEEQLFSILDIVSMDFNTPHLVPTPPGVPLEHFSKNIEAREVVRNIEELQKAEEEVRRMLITIRSNWEPKQPVAATEIARWEAAKEEFRKPLARYQEVLNDLYFHVLAQVDKYNVLAREAGKVYVGVKGILAPYSEACRLFGQSSKRYPTVRRDKFVPQDWGRPRFD